MFKNILLENYNATFCEITTHGSSKSVVDKANHKPRTKTGATGRDQNLK